MTSRTTVAVSFALSLAFLACGDDDDPRCDPIPAGAGWSISTEAKTFRFDSTVSDRMRSTFAAAAIPWNAVTRSEMAITFKPDAAWLIQVRTLPPRCDGVTDLAAKVLAVRPGLSDDTALAASEHELGHALGLLHIPDEARGVMNRTVSETTLSASDLAECARVNACEAP